MIYKFAAADMDGTLLNDKNEITPYTIEIIRQAAAQGLIFSICTGRPIQGVERYQKQDTWKTTRPFPLKGFVLIQKIMMEGKELSQEIPYDSIVVTEFAEKSHDRQIKISPHKKNSYCNAVYTVCNRSFSDASLSISFDFFGR